MSAESRSGNAEMETSGSPVREGIIDTFYTLESYGVDDWHKKTGFVELDGERYHLMLERNGQEIKLGYTDGNRNPLYLEAEHSVEQRPVEDAEVLKQIIRELE